MSNAYSAIAHQIFTNTATRPRMTTVRAVHGTRVTNRVVVSFCLRVSIMRHE